MFSASLARASGSLPKLGPARGADRRQRCAWSSPTSGERVGRRQSSEWPNTRQGWRRRAKPAPLSRPCPTWIQEPAYIWVQWGTFKAWLSESSQLCPLRSQALPRAVQGRGASETELGGGTPPLLLSPCSLGRSSHPLLGPRVVDRFYCHDSVRVKMAARVRGHSTDPNKTARRRCESGDQRMLGGVASELCREHTRASSQPLVRRRHLTAAFCATS